MEHAELWGVEEENAFPNMEIMVKLYEEPIHAVLIATPIYTHYTLAKEALQLGLNVILEKNMASSIVQARDLVETAEKHSTLCTSLGTQYRFRPNWWTIHKELQKKDSIIGKLGQVRASYIHKQTGEMRSGWRRYLRDIYPEDMMVHHMDVLRFCTGMEAIQVQATVFKPNYSKWQASSTVSVNMIFAPKGKELDKEEWVYVHYYGDWQARGQKEELISTFKFIGKKGSLTTEPPQEPQEHIWERTPVQNMVGEPAGSQIVAYIDKGLKDAERIEIVKDEQIMGNEKKLMDQLWILQEMYDGIKSKGEKQPSMNFKDAYNSFIICRAAVESSKTGKSIWMPQFWRNPIEKPPNLDI